MNILQNIKLVVFDLDGTLTTTNSWSLLHRTQSLTLDFEKKLRIARLNGLLSTHDWCEKVVSSYSAQEPIAPSRSILESIEYRTGAQDFVMSLKKYKGVEQVLVSCAPDFYAHRAAEELGMNNVKTFFTVAERLGRVVSISSELSGSESSGKAMYVKRYVESKAIDTSEVLVIGDSENDYELFTTYKHTITFTDAHPELKSIARYVVKDFTELLS